MNENTLVINIVDATYLEGYTLQLFFSDGTQKKVDFSASINLQGGYYAKYKKLENFKKFRLVDGTITWGRDFDLFYPFDQLYKGKIKV